MPIPEWWNRRLHDFEAFDEIKLRVVPRLKNSDLSGSSWRTGVEISFWFKGHVVAKHWATSMRWAISLLWHYVLESSEPIPERVMEIERNACAQPGCQHLPFVTYQILQRYTAQGEKLAASDGHLWKDYRRFCAQHAQRGDAIYEDRMENYKIVEDPK